LLVFRSARAEAVGALRTAARQFLRAPSSAALLGAARTATIGNAGLVARQAWRYVVERRAFNPDDLGMRLLCFVEQPAREDSRVTLGQNVDAFGMRRAALHWVLGAAELQAAGHFASSVQDAFRACGLAEVRIEPALAAQDAGFLDRGWDNFHHMGTARMAEGPRDGVVDRNLAMFGAANGYICGCAVFPNGGFSNPTHTAIALAVRLAEHLAQACRR
jgi:choline dehydrogenase-like flavoprotein